MQDAVKSQADLICLPETFQVTGLELSPDLVLELADEENGDLADKLREFARANQVNIVAPVLGRYGLAVRNVAWIISRQGEFVGRFFKVHPTNGELDRGVISGDEWPVFELDFGTVGVMICHDNSFPESTRCLALNGAEIVCWPHVQSGWGDVAWDITLRSRAIDNAVYIMSSCYGAPENTAWRPGMMVGRSGVVAPDGTVLVDGGRKQGWFSTTVDLDQVLLKRDFSYAGDQDFKATMLEGRRPDTYGPLTRLEVRV